MVDVSSIKKDFPILNTKINGKDLVYLDNAATSQKPISVIRALKNYYEQSNANVHRGAHSLADKATSLYEKSREVISKFIGASLPEEIVFVRNTTEGINLVAYSFALNYLKQGDEILIGIWEHHSNLVPWQQVCLRTGAKLVYTYPNNQGLFDFTDFKNKINKRTKIVALTHASNVLGTIFPLEEISKYVKKAGAFFVVDAAQSAPHLPLNVRELDCDFASFSGHKMLGPMGIGVLYVKYSMYDFMQPFLTGGGMINQVEEGFSSWEKPPHKFEAGTPNVGGAWGLAQAIDYLQNIGMKNIKLHEENINEVAISTFERLKTKVKGLHFIGPKEKEKRTGLISFCINGVHPHDVSSLLNQYGVAIRSGYHCAMPLHKYLELGPTCRASWYIYNDESDIKALENAILEAVKILS